MTPKETAERRGAPRAPAAEGAPGAVDVEICGHRIHLACEPGQEARVRRLAAEVDARARALAASGVTPANTPLQRILLMTSLMLADELEDARSAARAPTPDAGEPAATISPGAALAGDPDRAPADALDHAFARVLIDAAQRLEAAAARLEGGERHA